MFLHSIQTSVLIRPGMLNKGKSLKGKRGKKKKKKAITFPIVSDLSWYVSQCFAGCASQFQAQYLFIIFFVGGGNLIH